VHCYLSHTPSPFCVGYFWDQVLLYAQDDLHCDPPIWTSLCSWGSQPVLPCWGLANFLPRLTLNCNPLNLKYKHESSCSVESF
jgi:hypothetical protein